VYLSWEGPPPPPLLELREDRRYAEVAGAESTEVLERRFEFLALLDLA